MKTQNLKFSLAALVAAASLAHPARAATLTVTSLADSGFGTLRQQIANAANGDTIVFRVTGTITLTSGQLVLRKKLNIIGPPPNKSGVNRVTVSGNDQSRVFDITATGDVEISKLNIAQGFAFSKIFQDLENGGGIRNLGSLRLTACTVRDNVSTADRMDGDVEVGGGGIFNLGTMLVENCRILHNQAGYDQFSLYLAGGGILNLAKIKLLASTIAQNRACYGAGLAHAASSLSPPRQLEIVSCTFNDSKANRGGGVFIQSSGDLETPLIDQTTFVANYATETGGAIWTENSLSINNSTISGNSAFETAGGLAVDPYNFTSATQNVIAALNNVTITANTTLNVVQACCVTSGNAAGVIVGNVYEGMILRTRLVAANTIIAGNYNVSNPTGINDVYGRLISLGHNLIEDTTGTTITGNQTGNIYGLNPKLHGLAHNGGPTLTHALIIGSPAINAGDDATAEPTDQRGVARPVGPHSDIGAYEGSIPGRLGLNLLYLPVPYIIICDPAGSFPPWQGSILGSREFDVRTINAKTLRLQSRTAGPLSLAYRDVNDDGIMDLMLTFDLNQALQGQVCEAVTQLDLTGQTLSNQPIFGAVQVEAVAR